MKYIACKRLAKSDNGWINVYLLTKAGVREAREWLECTFGRELPELSYALHSSFFKHELLNLDVFVKLVSEKKVTVEDLFKGQYMDSRLAPIIPSVLRNKASLRPDSRFLINDCNFMIEIDRGTESISKIKQKLASYEKYFAANPSTKLTVLFLIDTPINWRRFHQIRELAVKYLGQLDNGGSKWFTLPFQDLDFVIKQLIVPEFFEECIDKLIELAPYKESLLARKAIFDYQFMPSAPMAAAWIGFRDTETNYTQFYVVESVIGGDSGALQRLKYFGEQYSEFFNKNGGQKIRLILLGNDPRDLAVVSKMYPKLIGDLIYVLVPELLSNTSKVIIGKEEEVK
jgi:hypothetical protein